MKIDRLIGILSILLQQKQVTAPYLAERFEVSRRTINRDIEDLCKAGIPVVTQQGVNGGISIMEGYKIDRTLLTSTDLQAIFAGLRSLDSVSGTNRYGQLMEKLSVGASNVIPGDQHILIDLASWNKESLAPKIEIIHGAIERQELLSFTYFSPKEESEREIEPYHLVFQWSSWYVWGWCRKRCDFRLFKLNRITHLHYSGKTFEKRKVPMPDLSAEKVFPHKLQVKAIFAPECKWRLIEEFGSGSFTEQPDGNLLFTVGFTDRENLLSWMLTFGDKAELLEPVEVREELLRIGEAIQKKYK
ncbi:helix-turn-helix transcriptional regulator [Roseburia sp. 499]|uniref:helix-turn-helix transcriptional regulator n=1 Tax=Roseburia sp. 499 TaxID=1261634 RepID=UPI0009527D5E|nr:YafY family protein [Roseburia sp. 499]WVK70450.1 YafY family protein [Roseburia sp. 499]